jgi:hypothetical protein
MSNTFKEIPGYEGLYAIDTNGNVMRIGRGNGTQPGKILKPYLKRGYFYVKLCVKDYTKDYLVSRLVALTHIGPIPEKYQVDHINRIKTDNRLENLRICTRSENNANRKFPFRKNLSNGFIPTSSSIGINFNA